MIERKDIRCAGRGLFEVSTEGTLTYLAMTFTRSRWFKSKPAAIKWLTKQGYWLS